MESEQYETTVTEEEILKRHRQERKDLQAKVQALKKTATKGDKKKKKEVTDTIAQLEQELDAKQAAELENLSLTNSPNNSTNENPDPEPEPQPEENEIEPEVEPEPQEPVRVSRAQKRRNKKQNADREREKRIAEQEETNKQGPRVLELNTIKTILQNVGLQIFNIPADGNCLYCAINHQLEVTGRSSLNVTKLRKLTASFMRDNKDEFLPFMYNDDDGVVDEDRFEKYCKDVANTKLWGGQLELTALSNVLKCPIKVIQASGPSTVQGESFDGPPLTLTYHKHLYRLGEHYNSTVKLAETEEMDDTS